MNVYRISPPVNCTWSDWTWHSCSKSCGGGTQNGTRTISTPARYGGSECTGQSTTSKSCNSEVCPKSKYHVMTVGYAAAGYPPCQFYSLSPSEHPLPTCLENLCQKDINIG